MPCRFSIAMTFSDCGFAMSVAPCANQSSFGGDSVRSSEVP